MLRLPAPEVRMSFFLLVACSDTVIVDRGGETVGSDDPVEDTAAAALDAEWSGASLVVNSPLSASFLPLGETATFSATVYGADGQPKEFDDITWSSDVDTDWALTGPSVDDANLGVGVHAITAEAQLPNGDRLASTMGGILVQSIYAGVYTGELLITASGDYNGTAYSVGCSGPLTLVVDAEGETVTGDAGCLIALFGYELDTTYLFDLQNDDGELSGEAAIDLTYFEYGVETLGSLSEEGALDGDFSADVYGYVQMEGVYSATLLTRDLSSVQ